MSNTEKNNRYIKDDRLNIKALEKDMAWIMRLTNTTVWFLRAKNTLDFISIGVVGAAWMSLLLIFIWTGNLLLLKIWATPISLAAMIACIVTGLEAFIKNKEIDTKEKHKHILSREELKIIQNSLNLFNDYERKIESKCLFEKPTYEEYKAFVLSIKPQLSLNEDLIKLWYMMFDNGRWTNAGFLIRDWKTLTTNILLNIDDQLEQYINFYSIKQAKKHNDEI